MEVEEFSGSDSFVSVLSDSFSGRSFSDSPSSKIYPNIVPTLTTFPSSTSILPSFPSVVASTSELTLEDSISTNLSLFEIGSPIDFNHFITCPSFIPIPHCGKIIGVGIYSPKLFPK